MTYEELLFVGKDTLSRLNGLLSIESLEDNLTEEQLSLNPKADDCINWLQVTFENGNYITIDVCSGSENYYDNCVLCDKEGRELTTFDCNYSIDEEMEFNYGDDTYIVSLVSLQEFDTLEDLQNDDELQKMPRYCWKKVMLNGEEVFACTTNQQYEDIVWSGIYDVLEEFYKHFGINIEDKQDELTDFSSEIRDFILGLLEKKDDIKLVDVYDEY